jgi:hypothetical protein
VSALRQTQELFWSAIVHPTSVDDFLEGADAETRLRFGETFLGTPEFPASARVEIYARGYFYRLLDVLRAQFPVVAAYLGPNAFHDLVTDFLLAHPSRSPNLHDLGDPFPEFVDAHPAAGSLPQLADFARIERALAHALDAPDGEVLSAATLSRVVPERWPTFRFVPSVTLVEAAWDMRAAQRALRDESPLPAPQPSASTLVWRLGYVPLFRPSTPFERSAFSNLEKSCSFDELCELAEVNGLDAAALSKALRGWLEEELLEAGTPV